MQEALSYRGESTVRRRLRLPPAQELLFRILLAFFIFVGLVIAALPFVWMAISSFGTAGMVIRIGFSWEMFDPRQWTLEPYVVAWRLAGISKYIQTTTLYAASVTILATTTSSLAGYVFGRLRFPGRDLLFGLVLATMMIPGSVTFLPLFILMLRLPLAGGNDIFGVGGHGLYNNFAGLVLPNMVSAGAIFLFRQFFRTLPKDLEDAARIDGCSEPGIWWRVL